MDVRRRFRDTAWIDRMRSIWLLSECSAREIRTIRSLCTPIDVPSGRTLVAQGQRPSQFFINARGTAVVSVDHRPVALIEAGSFFGERVVSGVGVNPATVMSATPMELLVFSRLESVDLFARSIPSLEDKVAAILAERRRALDELARDPDASTVLEQLGDLSVRQRTGAETGPGRRGAERSAGALAHASQAALDRGADEAVVVA